MFFFLRSLVSPFVIFEKKFAFHSILKSLSCENTDVTFSWKSLNTYQFIPSRENHVTVSYVYTRKQCVVYPLGYPCSSELCILVCFSQADLHFNIIYIPSPDFMSSYISRNINLKPYLSCIANAAVCSNNTDPLVSSLISDQRPQLRSSRPRASVTTWEWQRVSHSSGAWAKLSVTAATAEQFVLNVQLSVIVAISTCVISGIKGTLSVLFVSLQHVAKIKQ